MEHGACGGHRIISACTSTRPRRQSFDQEHRDCCPRLFSFSRLGCRGVVFRGRRCTIGGSRAGTKLEANAIVFLALRSPARNRFTVLALFRPAGIMEQFSCEYTCSKLVWCCLVVATSRVYSIMQHCASLACSSVACIESWAACRHTSCFCFRLVLVVMILVLPPPSCRVASDSPTLVQIGRWSGDTLFASRSCPAE